jgi:hypothetical protein
MIIPKGIKRVEVILLEEQTKNALKERSSKNIEIFSETLWSWSLI